MASLTLPRAATGNRMMHLQLAYGLMAMLIVALPFSITMAGTVDGDVPEWLPIIIVLAVASFSIFAVFFQRIRPVAPGSIRGYRRVIARRVWYSILPAIAGSVLYVATGHWSAVALGALLSLPGFVFAMPSQDDFIRHQEIWNERLPLPPTKVWGTAEPDAIPPWEDPEGGHGHGIGHHGLH